MLELVVFLWCTYGANLGSLCLMSGLAFDSDVPLEYEEDTMEEESLALPREQPLMVVPLAWTS